MILVIDLHNLAHRAAHAYEKLWSGEVFTGLYFGVFKMLGSYIKELKPDIIAIVSDPMDYAEKTPWRAQYLPSYKGARKTNRTAQQQRHYNAIQAQLPVLKMAFHMLPVYWFEQAYLEADDLIGYLTKYFWANESCTIISTDKDLFQLVDATTSVFYPGQKNRLWITCADLPEKLSRFVDGNKKVEPNEWWFPSGVEDWLEYRKLMGDASDNIPGFPGIGKKRAWEIMRVGGLEAYRMNLRTKKKLGKLDTYILSEEADAVFALNDLLMRLPQPNISNHVNLQGQHHGQCQKDATGFVSWCKSFEPPLKETQNLLHML